MSRACTSATLTVLIRAPCRIGATMADPRSLRKTASTAEESSTARSANQSSLSQNLPVCLMIARKLLFFLTPRFLAAVGDQFVGSKDARFDIFCELLLNPPD